MNKLITTHLAEHHAARLRNSITAAEKAHAVGDHAGVHKALKHALADETLPEKHASKIWAAADDLRQHLK